MNPSIQSFRQSAPYTPFSFGGPQGSAANSLFGGLQRFGNNGLDSFSSSGGPFGVPQSYQGAQALSALRSLNGPQGFGSPQALSALRAFGGSSFGNVLQAFGGPQGLSSALQQYGGRPATGFPSQRIMAVPFFYVPPSAGQDASQPSTNPLSGLLQNPLSLATLISALRSKS